MAASRIISAVGPRYFSAFVDTETQHTLTPCFSPTSSLLLLLEYLLGMSHDGAKKVHMVLQTLALIVA